MLLMSISDFTRYQLQVKCHSVYISPQQSLHYEMVGSLETRVCILTGWSLMSGVAHLAEKCCGIQ
jgi:hypothetical protein